MNHNFLGQPTREDTQTLDRLRRQLMPMIGLLDKLHADMQHKMHRGEVVDWPQIRHTISAINSKLTSINGYINGYYKHAEEPIKDSNGNPMLDEENNPRMRYIDTANPGEAERIGALHAFPLAPYPINVNDQLAYMADILLEKRLGPNEQKWVEERLRKAAEFAYVPGELGIDARKPVEVKDESDDEDDGMKGWNDGIPTKRIKGTLNEDQIMEMWSVGHKTAFDKTYAKNMRFDEGEGEDEDEDDEEEDMEDVKIEGLTPTVGGDAQGARAQGTEGDQDMGDGEDGSEDADTPKAPPVPVVMIQRAPPAVHKPVPGKPSLSLSFVHRFMTSGEVEGAASQR